MHRMKEADRLEWLFEQALAHPPAEQKAFLEKACGGNTDLRMEVESLLAHEDAGNFMKQPVLPERKTPIWKMQGLSRGRMLGPYQLRAKIGEGGMSTVYRAVRADDQFHKQVAIKLVPTAMANTEHLRRFHIERHILASLDHPNIARLFDAGTTDEGLPYFVMEYVEGEPIDAYCDRHRLAIPERIGLFREVCKAVHYAHQNLIVHRDLKPGNILVTERGEAKLLDFGIAKLTNPDLTSPDFYPTLTCHRLLTPDYASPEQVLGKTITTASDVYSLGVLLFRLLCGRLPRKLGGKTPQEMERILTHVEPEIPSLTLGRKTDALETDVEDSSPHTVSRLRNTGCRQLQRLLSGDLDKIILMALRVEPQRRYQSVEQLSEDLRRHLTGLPVLARKDTLAYRTGKFLGRNRLAVTFVGLFLALVLAFTSTVSFQSMSILKERDQARRERDNTARVLTFVEEIFKEADPTETREKDMTVREALDGCIAKLKEFDDQPKIKTNLLVTIGKIYLNLGEYARAGAHLSSALKIQRLFEEDDLTKSETLQLVGEAFHKMGDFETTEKLFREALNLSRNILGDNHPGLLDPMNNLVGVLGEKGELEEAELVARKTLALARSFPGKERLAATRTLLNMAGLKYNRGDYEGAQHWMQEALSLQREILGHHHPETLIAQTSLGIILYKKGELAEAYRILEKALAIQREILDAEHPDLIRTLHHLAVVLVDQGAFQKAEPLLEEVRDLRTQVLGSDHPSVAYTLSTLANLRIKTGHPETAEPLLRKSLHIWRENLEPDSWQIVQAENLLGECLTRLGRYEEAESTLLKTYNQIMAVPGGDKNRIRNARNRLFDLYQTWNQPEKAKEFKDQD